MSSARWDALYSFFCQAEDGIRDIGVTGVQTCALPICGTQISGGGAQYVFGSAAATVVSNLGSQYISAGLVTGATILGGGWQFDFGNGSAVDTVVSSTGNQDVYSGGTATGTTLMSAAWQFVWGGGSASSTNNSAGYVDVYSGGVANGVAIQNGGGWGLAWSGGPTSGATR